MEEADSIFDEPTTDHEAALERLREQVERAASAIEALRNENEALRERVEELEAALDERPAVGEGETVIAFDESPEALRDQVRTFIEAIDGHLAEQDNSEQNDR